MYKLTQRIIRINTNSISMRKMIIGLKSFRRNKSSYILKIITIRIEVTKYFIKELIPSFLSVSQ